MITREAMKKLLRPKVEELVGELADLLWGRLETQLDQALDAARSALLSDLEGSLIPAKERNRARSNQLRRDADAAVAAGNPRPRRTVSCRNCGAVGFTSKGCGITHSIPGAAPAVVDEESTEVEEAEVAPVEVEAAVQPDDEESENDPPDDEGEGDEDSDDEGEEVEPAGAPELNPRNRFERIEAQAEARRAGEIKRSVRRSEMHP